MQVPFLQDILRLSSQKQCCQPSQNFRDPHGFFWQGRIQKGLTGGGGGGSHTGGWGTMILGLFVKPLFERSRGHVPPAPLDPCLFGAWHINSRLTGDTQYLTDLGTNSLFCNFTP